jgi:alanyl-tRNA synthetase
MRCQEIREKWIKFFTEKCPRKHKYYESASLIPNNPTLLLTAAGMVPFVDYFVGLKKAPNPPRAVSIQKCVRVGGKDSDLDNIGRTTRHHSFFEMLGNFSFGDYFKKEAIEWAWQFVTQELGIPPEKLYVSVFAGDEINAFDEEAYEHWSNIFAALMGLAEKDGTGLTQPSCKASVLGSRHTERGTGANSGLSEDAERINKVSGSGLPATQLCSNNADISQASKSGKIFKMGRKDNFWGPPGKTGPCGPCSEIYYDRGLAYSNPQANQSAEDLIAAGLSPVDEHPDRFIEIWNLVFMEFNKDDGGNFTPLASKNIDTGAGLERLAMVLQDKENTFETDELFSIFQKLYKITDESIKTIEKEKINNILTERNISKSERENIIQSWITQNRPSTISVEGFIIGNLRGQLNFYDSTPQEYIIEEPYNPQEEPTAHEKVMLKIITDHLRCLVFLISDGVRPSNLGRGYVLRMIIRRAARFLYLLRSSADAFLYQVIDEVVKQYSKAYPELERNRQTIKDICKQEEEQFAKTITKGTAILEEALNGKNPKALKSNDELKGDFVFDLYSTYGFPKELTAEIANEHNISIDEAGYEAARQKHSEASSTNMFNMSWGILSLIKRYGTTQFLGYETLIVEDCKLLGIFLKLNFPKFYPRENPPISQTVEYLGYDVDSNQLFFTQLLNTGTFILKDYFFPETLSRIEQNREKISSLDYDKIKPEELSNVLENSCELGFILDQTPFYAESGGQVGDVGILKINNFEFKVKNTKSIEGTFVHYVSVPNDIRNGFELIAGDTVEARVDETHRALTKSHHSACHLLQAALRKVLGAQIQQAGSQVGPEYTRFDFNFDRALTKDEVQKIEDQVNDWIKQRLPVSTSVMDFNEAIKAGALAFFGDKYEDKVRVLSMGKGQETASIELCGGTHVSNTEEIKAAKIVSESSVAAGIRRIRMLTSKALEQYLQEQTELNRAKEAEQAAKAKAAAEEKQRKQELEKQIDAKVDKLMQNATDISGSKAVIINVNEFFDGGLESDMLKSLAETLRDRLKNQYGSSLVILGTNYQNKAIFIATCSENVAAKVFNAGALVKTAAEICGGGGGGRTNFAQAGGKDASKIQDALNTIKANLA